MEDWKKYYNEAECYSKAAFGAYKKSKLGNQVVYNLIGLAIENYLTSMCIKLGSFPEHSSIGSMLALLKKKTSVPKNFQTEARFINKFMNFCSLDVFEPKDPTRPDLVRMLVFTEDVKIFCDKQINPTNQLTPISQLSAIYNN